MEWMILPLKRYAQFSGRSRRKEFWMFWLLLIIGMFLFTWLDSALGLGGTTETWSEVEGMSASVGYRSTGGVLTLLFLLAMLVPSLAVSVRRLHDVDKSGWWLLIGLVPLAGAIYLLYHYVQPGTTGPNRFGPDPLAQEREAAPA